MAGAYTRLHELGHAHSFEVWHEGVLAGGLYGVAIGKVFFGESMFTRVRDASKISLLHSARFLSRRGFELIDCQLPSEHLRRLGARNMPRPQFLEALERLCAPSGEVGIWSDAFSAERHKLGIES